MWIEIFKTGTHTSSNGHSKTWTINDLDKMVKQYDPLKREAPLVLGHPENNAPAYGWVEALKRQGNILLAKFKDIVPEFKNIVNEGLYKKRSISLYPDKSLRHVGFLGAAQPAVPGLKDFKFENGEELFIYDFEEKKEKQDMPLSVEELKKQLETEKAAREKAETDAKKTQSELEKQQAEFAEVEKKQKCKEIGSFIEQGIKDGKILPAWKEQGIVEFMSALHEDSENKNYEFSEGKKQSLGQWFQNFISSFSEHGLFKEMIKPNNKDEDEFSEDMSDIAQVF
ncbi:Peptidase [Candidatus Magnetomoraceae bacterium gMMP-15]